MGRSRCARPDKLPSKLGLIRAHMGITLEQMAGRLREPKIIVFPGHIREFESGDRHPSVLTLLKYSKIARVSLETLVDDELDLPKRFQR